MHYVQYHMHHTVLLSMKMANLATVQNDVYSVMQFELYYHYSLLELGLHTVHFVKLESAFSLYSNINVSMTASMDSTQCSTVL